MFTVRATVDYDSDSTAQTEDYKMAEAIFDGLVLTNRYAQVELEDARHCVIKATYSNGDTYSDGASAGIDIVADVCPACGEPISYVADFGAPGVGQSWKCANGHSWAKVGQTLYDPSEGAHVLRPEEVW